MKTVTYLIALLIAFASCVITTSAEVTPPRPVDTPAPAYPSDLEDTGQSGQALIELTITALGQVERARVQTADHPAFGRAALAVLDQWRFEPARHDGEPVSQRVVLPFNFRAPVDQQFNAMVGRKVFQHLPPDTEIIDEAQMERKLRPVNPITIKPGVAMTLQTMGQLSSVRFVPPVLPRSLQDRKFDEVITVRCLVASDGSVINPELEEMPRTAELAGPALLSAAMYRFHPPRLSNRSAYVRTTLTIDFSAANKPEDDLWWQYEQNVPFETPGPGGAIRR